MTAYINTPPGSPGSEPLPVMLTPISVQDYLRSLQWDGVERLGTLFQRYFGANPRYNRFSKAFFVSAVARVYAPGRPMGALLVLAGAGGEGKSAALQALVSPRWFGRGDAPEVGDGGPDPQIAGKWIWEISELGGGRGVADRKKRSRLIRACVDVYRPPYSRQEMLVPRWATVVGTTNEDQYKADRLHRAMVIHTGCVDVPALRQDRDMIWAEAVVLYQRDSSPRKEEGV